MKRLCSAGNLPSLVLSPNCVAKAPDSLLCWCHSSSHLSTMQCVGSANNRIFIKCLFPQGTPLFPSHWSESRVYRRKDRVMGASIRGLEGCYRFILPQEGSTQPRPWPGDGQPPAHLPVWLLCGLWATCRPWPRLSSRSTRL